MPAVTLDTVGKHFPGGVAALAGVSLDAADGSCLGVVGPSGAGKTTLLRLVAGLERPDAGRVLLDGQDVTHLPPHRRSVAWLPQRPALYAHLTVERNLMAGVEMQGGSRAEARDRAREAAEWLGLTGLLGRRPGELSGGEEQRVALGRAVARRAGVWLLDEPFAHLDPARRLQLRRDLPLLARRSGATILFVTHDPAEAAALADRLAVLISGRLVQCDRPGVVWDHPARVTVAEWLARLPLNRVDGSVERRPGGWQFRDPSGALARFWPDPPERGWRDGQAVTALVRPEDVTLGDDGPLAAAAGRDEPLWPGRLWTVAAGGRDWFAWRPGSAPPGPRLRVDRAMWFEAEGGGRLDTA